MRARLGMFPGREVVRAVWAGALVAGLGAGVALASPGDLDTSFSNDGIAEIPSPVVSVAVHADASTVFAAAHRFAVLVGRVTPAGAPDPTFGATGSGTVRIDFPGYNVYSARVAVQPDGKVVLAGTVCAPAEPAPTDCSFAAARLLPTGQYDPGFAFGGKIVVPMGDSASYFHTGVRAVVIDNGTPPPRPGGSSSTGLAPADSVLDGGILIAGSAPDPVAHVPVFALLRLRPSGWPDASFGHLGKAWVNVGGGWNSQAEAVAVQSTGKIVLAGFAWGPPAFENMALARLNRNGTLDTAFGTGGTVVTVFSRAPNAVGSSRAAAMALQTNDAIIAGGSGYIQWPSALVYNGPLIRRFSRDGALDTSFNGGATGWLWDATGHVHGLAVQPDDRVLVTGWHNAEASPHAPQYVAYRLQPSGLLDPTFGVDGLRAVTGGIAWAVTVQRYGCIVLGGFANYPDAPATQWRGVLIRLVGDRTPRPWERPCHLFPVIRP